MAKRTILVTGVANKWGAQVASKLLAEAGAQSDSDFQVIGLDAEPPAHEIKGLERIRYTTSHPRDMSDDLIAVHALPKLMPFLHLPVQSGSDAILKTMNRKHKIDIFHEIIAKLRRVRPDIGFSSDFIIGFPGETDQDFEDTMK